jgi:hypothetical protein
MKKSLLKKAVVLAMSTLVLGTSGMALASEADKSNNVEIRYWNPSLSSNVQVGNGGTNIDAKSTLGIDDKSFTEVRVNVGKTKLAYVDLNYTGNRTLTENFTFNDKTYVANEKADSKLDIKYYRIGWDKELAKTEKVTQNLMFDIKVLQMDASVKASLNGVSVVNESKSVTAPIPTIGYNIKANVAKNTDVYAEISGLPLGSYGHFYDSELGVKYSTPGNITIGAGYRVFDLDLHKDDDQFKFKMNGPFFNVSYKF